MAPSMHRPAPGKPSRSTHHTVLLPGLVDSHVHICEPGNTEWEGFSDRDPCCGGRRHHHAGRHATGQRADDGDTGGAGGQAQRRRGPVSCRCRLLGRRHPVESRRPAKLHDGGVLGFKSFLCDTGTDDFPGITPQHMENVMRVVAGLGSLFIVHAESAEASARIPKSVRGVMPTFWRRGPRASRTWSIAEVIEAARATGARAHILHSSSADALPMMLGHRRRGAAQRRDLPALS